MVENYVSIEGLETFYLRDGKGPPLVLIHGGSPGACSSVNWGLNIEPLAAAGFTVYAFDQPGFGRTEQPADYSLDYRITHARVFMSALGLSAFYLVGNSMGAYIAAKLALEQGERARGLVLVSSSTLAPPGSEQDRERSRRHTEKLRDYRPGLENMRELTMGTLWRKSLVTDDLVRLRHAMSIGQNFAAHVARGKVRGFKPIHDDLKNLKCRTLIFWGRNDEGASPERALLLLKAIPKAELHVFDQCAHWVQWDQSARFNRLVADFFHQESPAQ